MTPSSIPATIDERAERAPRQRAFTFLDHAGEIATTLNYAELRRQVRAVGLALLREMRPGERAILACESPYSFVIAFLAMLSSGIIAVPTYLGPSGSSERLLSRLATLEHDCHPAGLVVDGAVDDALRDASGGRVSTAVPVAERRYRVDDLLRTGLNGVSSREPSDPESSQIAYLQYTSGTTREACAVMITHANLAAHSNQMKLIFGSLEGRRGVSWLPLFHDMGLILGIIDPVLRGYESILISPLAFLQRPLVWLKALSDFKATHSAGPVFALELCARRAATDDIPERLHLGGLKTVLVGAEPVRAEAVRSFETTFREYGLRPGAIAPAYGLAEATLAVTVAYGDVGPREYHMAGRCRPMVSCGEPLPGVSVAIVEPHSGQRCPNEREGEIWIQSPTVGAGYWGRADETRATFGARLVSGEGPFLRTGDLGLLSENRLFVTGRRRDVLNVRGRKWDPHDVELACEESTGAVRRGRIAAFVCGEGVDAGIVIAAELRRGNGASGRELDAIRSTIFRAIGGSGEVPLRDVLLLAPGSLPTTTSGKVRRHAAREMYLSVPKRGRHGAGRRSEAAGHSPPGRLP